MNSELTEERITRCKRYLELDNLCYLAITMEEQALLGTPEEERIKFSREYAPFNPENLNLWRESANLGIPNGCYLLGQCLLNGGETEEGLRWLKTAASKGNLRAKGMLGDFLLDKGKTKEGLKLLHEAADSDDAYACDILANKYRDGEGVPKSRSKSRYYFERAASLGSFDAQNCLDDYDLATGRCWWKTILSIIK